MVHKFRKFKNGKIVMGVFTEAEAKKLDANWVDDPHVFGWNSMQPMEILSHQESLFYAGIKAEPEEKKIEPVKEERKEPKKVLLYNNMDILTMTFRDLQKLNKEEVHKIYTLLGGKGSIDVLKRTTMIKYILQEIKRRREENGKEEE